MMQPNITGPLKTSSDGAWNGNNPLNYAFPLLIVQTTLVLVLSRLLTFILKPLRQPKVIAEILGGILLGPSALGRNKEFLQTIFPSWSTAILESIASIGLLFFLFLVGLELDLSAIQRSGRKAFTIALAGISLPFLLGAGVTLLLKKSIHEEHKVGYLQFLVFIGVSLSITAFPVLARILAELKLLTTQVGETAMAAAAFNDVAAWILLALAVALAGGHKSPLTSIWVLISGVAFIAFMFIIIRPVMNWVGQRCSLEHHDYHDEAYISLTLLGVMISGFVTDLIGIHSIFGAFVYGLMIPKGSQFASKLIRKIEDFVSGLLLPLYFASSGLKTDVSKICGVEAWGLLLLVISTACAGKILGTFMVAMLFTIPTRESLALGVLMNTKGLVELIVLNIGKEKKILNDEIFAILVLMALFTTFITTPAVIAIYKPLRYISPSRSYSRTKKDQILRILTCVHGPSNAPSIISLVESITSVNKSQLKLYVMHLVELTDRPSSIMMVRRARKNGVPFTKSISRGIVSHTQITYSFEVYSKENRAAVRHSTAISALSTMHEDICHVAEDKRAAMIILPFHKLWRGEEDVEENVGNGWQWVNQKVSETGPCSVAVLVDRGYGEPKLGFRPHVNSNVVKRVCVLFLGGVDDREGLELSGQMAQHPALRVTIVRFICGGECTTRHSNRNSITQTENDKEEDQDEAAMAEMKSKWNGSVEFREKVLNNIKEEVMLLGQSRQYELIVVGKGNFPSRMAAKLPDYVENAELGPIGDILASRDNNIVSSVLVIRACRSANQNETNALKMVMDKDALGDDNTDNDEPSV